MQVLAIVVTIAMAVVSGLITGFLMKFMSRPEHEYMDVENFEVPVGKKDFLRGTIREPKFGGRDVDAFDDLAADGHGQGSGQHVD